MNRLKSILRCNLLYIVLTIFTLLYSIINVYVIKKESIYNDFTTNIIGVVKKITIKDDKVIYEINAKENIIASYQDINILQIGDKVKFIGKLYKPNKNVVFNTFNYQKYLYNKKIYYLMNIDDIKIISKNNNILYGIKNSILKKINKSKNKEYLYAFILGDTSYINNIVKKSYQNNGISHLFAISGMHIGLIVLILNKIFKKKLSIYIFIIFYMFLTNFSPSIIRAGIFFIMLSINKERKLNISTIKILLLTLFISLLLNPYLITSIGFQYSFIISMFLILSSDIFKNKSKIYSLLYVSLIAFLASLIITINNFYQVNLLGIIYNMFFVPLISIIIFPLSIISYVITPIQSILVILIGIMEKISLYLSNIDILVIVIGKINIVLYIIYYIILYIVIKNYKNKKLYILLFVYFLIIYNKALFNFSDNLTFIDVGQGDSALITYKNNGGAVLIDTGGNSSDTYSLGNDLIVSYVKSLGIRKINYMIISHGDYDHIGEAIEIIDNIKVDKVILNNGNINNNEKQLINHINNKTKCLIKNDKDILTIKNNKLYIINMKSDDENDNSLVIYTKIDSKNVLFAGDIGKSSENYIINNYKLDVDILKVAHHGSNTSSSLEFINSIKPIICIISVGIDNKYNHPNKEVVELLTDKSEKVYLTSINGSIKFSFINKKTIITTTK